VVQEDNQAGAGFTAPPSVGNAEPSKNGGVVTKKKASKEATESAKKVVRNIKVVAIDKGWFDCKRIAVGTKFNVSEEEFSAKWMQEI
jgi:hypothetical protein